VEVQLRPSWVEVDLDAIMHNVAEIRRAVTPAAVCAVVKADGYGHGDVPVAEAALAGGAGWLAVALVEEAARLREAGIDAPILLLSEPEPADVAEVIAWDLRPTVYRSHFARALAAAAKAAHPVHVKVDTGMHRVGADPAAAMELLVLIEATEHLELESIWTHFAVAEEDEDYTRLQIRRLEEIIAATRRSGIEVPVVHAANTAGALAYEEARFDMVRVGLGIYGLRPAPHVGADVDLRPAMRVVSQVALAKRLAAGDRPSYGRRRALSGEATVATVPIGYADGVARRLSTVGGEVLIRGKRHPFAGTVTMDQIVVDAGDGPVAEGDEVVLLGRQGDAEISADEWAGRLDTISYEIVCGFGPRLPRRYVGGALGRP
jgi:alanine racemase